MAVNSGPPSVAQSSRMWNVANVRGKHSIRLLEPSQASSIMGQFEYLSRQQGSLPLCSERSLHIYIGKGMLVAPLDGVGHLVERVIGYMLPVKQKWPG